ncbi:MAG: 50S ribosomal protein L21 [Clostridia bacterium]|nr:50S ribosomal protein L21 [Clostridia bacterium]
MYAIIETGGKQYKVSQGDVIYVEKLDEAEGSSVDFKVIAGQDDKGFYVGNPDLSSAKVSGKVLKNGKGKKITVFTYKPKKSCKRKMGHRQFYTKVEIESIKF